jgi:hypothetical protein
MNTNRFHRCKMGLVLCFWGGALLGAGRLLQHGMRLGVDEYRFVSQAQSTVGEVVNYETALVQSKGLIPVYRRIYKFRDPAGEMLTAQSAETSLEKPLLRQQVSLLYNPAISHVPRLAGYGNRWGDVTRFLGTGGLLALLVVGSFRPLLRELRMIR